MLTSGEQAHRKELTPATKQSGGENAHACDLRRNQTALQPTRLQYQAQ